MTYHSKKDRGYIALSSGAEAAPFGKQVICDQIIIAQCSDERVSALIAELLNKAREKGSK